MFFVWSVVAVPDFVAFHMEGNTLTICASAKILIRTGRAFCMYVKIWRNIYVIFKSYHILWEICFIRGFNIWLWYKYTTYHISLRPYYLGSRNYRHSVSKTCSLAHRKRLSEQSTLPEIYKETAREGPMAKPEVPPGRSPSGQIFSRLFLKTWYIIFISCFLCL